MNMSFEQNKSVDVVEWKVHFNKVFENSNTGLAELDFRIKGDNINTRTILKGENIYDALSSAFLAMSFFNAIRSEFTPKRALFQIYIGKSEKGHTLVRRGRKRE